MQYKVVLSKNIVASTLGLILFALILPSISNDHDIIIQHAMAQNMTAPSGSVSETFSAQGSLGSLIIPGSLVASNITSVISGHQGSVIGGNWNFDVSRGSLQNFNVSIEMVRLDGKEDMTHSINGLKNATSAITSLTPSLTNTIFLNSNNNTSFRGFADITMNGKPMWSNVPVFVTLANGKLLNMSFDSIKTGDHFTGIPIFGIVTSLTK